MRPISVWLCVRVRACTFWIWISVSSASDSGSLSSAASCTPRSSANYAAYRFIRPQN